MLGQGLGRKHVPNRERRCNKIDKMKELFYQSTSGEREREGRKEL